MVSHLGPGFNFSFFGAAGIIPNSPANTFINYTKSENPVLFANSSYDSSLWKFSSVPLSVFIVLCLACVPLLTVSGNCLVVWAIMTQKSLQQEQNRLLISLAVADILVALVVMPFAIFGEIALTWRFGFVFCDIWRTLDVMCCTASILHLCAVALDRYWAITDPFTYSTKRTKKFMFFIIFVVWFLSFLISLPPVTIWHGEGHGDDGQGCELIADPVYIIYSALGSFYVPLAAMMLIYIRIYQVAAERVRAKTARRSRYAANNQINNNNSRAIPTSNIQGRVIQGCKISLQPSCSMLDVPSHAAMGGGAMSPQAGAEDTTHNGVGPHTGGGARHKTSVASFNLTVSTSPTRATHLDNGVGASPYRSRIRRPLISISGERKAANTLGVILGCFVLCWLPFFTLYILTPFINKIQSLPDLTFSIVTWLGYLNSMANPIIYTIFNPDFKKAFSKIFKCLDSKSGPEMNHVAYSKKFSTAGLYPEVLPRKKISTATPFIS